MMDIHTLKACLPSPPDYQYDWNGLSEIPSIRRWMDQMARTPQDPRWHGEGDVWKHTRMVCDILTGLPAFRLMEGDAQLVLALATLLHDVGKIQCTRRMENGEWASPHHGPIGAQMVREMLWQEFGMSGDPERQRFREAVCQLIRFHTRPVHLLDSRDPAAAALRLASCGELVPNFTLRALSLLAEADVLGRITPDTGELLEAIDLSRELAAEEECLDGPWHFPSAQTRRAFFRGGRVWKNQTLYDDTWGEVILMCGLPGTGKDTWIRQNAPDLPVVSLDDLRAEMKIGPEENQGAVVQAAKEKAKAFLRAKQSFIWNATSLSARRVQQIDLFEKYHARVKVVYLETGWEENLRRNAARNESVPETAIQRGLERLEPPMPEEAWQVEWHCI